MTIIDTKTGKCWPSVLCEVTENNYWITPDRNVGVVNTEKKKAARRLPSLVQKRLTLFPLL